MKGIKSGEKSLTPKQQERLLHFTGRTRDRVLLKLALATGARRNDIVRFTWAGVNWEESSITFLEKKKGSTPHTVYVPPHIIQLLRRWREFSRGKYIFPGRGKRTHISSKTAWNVLNRTMERAGIKRKGDPWPFHSLRATCIKNCQRAGWSPEETARHVNDSLLTIQRHYTTPTPEERKRVASEKPII